MNNTTTQQTTPTPTKHTPWPWHALPRMSECGWGVYATPLSYHVLDHTAPNIDVEANACLLAAAPTAPHDCDDPQCPGAINKRKLDAFDGLLEACGASLVLCNALGRNGATIAYDGISDFCVTDMIRAAIAKATGGGR